MKNFKRNMSKALASASTVAAMGTAAMTQVFAAGNGPTDINGNPSGDQAISGIIGGLCFVAKIVGIGLAAYGAYEIVLSFVQNQPESKIKGITMVGCGVCMFFLENIINGIVGL